MDIAVPWIARIPSNAGEMMVMDSPLIPQLELTPQLFRVMGTTVQLICLAVLTAGETQIRLRIFPLAVHSIKSSRAIEVHVEFWIQETSYAGEKQDLTKPIPHRSNFISLKFYL